MLSARDCRGYFYGAPCRWGECFITFQCQVSSGVTYQKLLKSGEFFCRIIPKIWGAFWDISYIISYVKYCLVKWQTLSNSPRFTTFRPKEILFNIFLEILSVTRCNDSDVADITLQCSTCTATGRINNICTTYKTSASALPKIQNKYNEKALRETQTLRTRWL